MNPELPKSPREEMELRITALLLGELSGDEAAAVREAMAKDPEFARLHDDLKETIQLVRAASTSAGEPAAELAAPLQLSGQRRQKLLTAFAIPPLKPVDRKSKRSLQLGLVEWVAVLAIVAVMAATLFTPLRIMRREEGQVSTTLDESTVAFAADTALERARAGVLHRTLSVPGPGQSNVYSLNVVGYVNVATQGYTLVEGAPKIFGQNKALADVAGKDATTVGRAESDFSDYVRDQQRGLVVTTSAEGLATPKPGLAHPASPIVLPFVDSDGDTIVAGVEFGRKQSTTDSLATVELEGLMSLEKKPATIVAAEPVSPTTYYRFASQGGAGGGGAGGAVVQNGTVPPSAGDRVAVLGDVPMLGKLFTSQPTANRDGTVLADNFAVSHFDTLAAAGGVNSDRWFDSKNGRGDAVTAQVAAESGLTPMPSVSLQQESKVNQNLWLGGDLSAEPAMRGAKLAETPVAEDKAALGFTVNAGDFGAIVPPAQAVADPAVAAAPAVTPPPTTSYELSLSQPQSPKPQARPAVPARPPVAEAEVSQRAFMQRYGLPSGDRKLVEAPTLTYANAVDETQPAKADGDIDALGTVVQAGREVTRSLADSETKKGIAAQPSDPAQRLNESVLTRGDHDGREKTRTLSEPVDKVPVLGDLPGIGKLFRSEPSQTLDRNGRLDAPASVVTSNGQTLEFVGYDDPGQFMPQGQLASTDVGGKGAPVKAQLPIPRYRPRTTEPLSKSLDSGAIILPPTSGGKVEQQIAQKQNEVEVLRRQIGISDLDAAGTTALPAIEGETLRRYKASLMEAEAKLSAMESSLEKSKVSEPEQRKQIERAKAEVERLEKSADEAERLDIERTTRSWPYYEKKRELAQLQAAQGETVHQKQGNIEGAQSLSLPKLRAALEANVGDDSDAIIVRKPATNAPIPQPETQTSENNFSTFSLNVSDVSFKLAAASLEKGQMPDPATVRSEEFINAFDYRDPEPTAGAPIAFAYERARYPFAHNRDLLRFSLKTAAAGRQAGRLLNVVLLLDNSGSMERADRVQIIREALRVLASQLQPQDKLSVITFARTPRLVADGISGDQAGEVAEAVGGLTPQGGTNLEDAMNLAYQTAAKHYLANGINRVVLLTDGAANLGNVEPDSLKSTVEAQRKQGIALDCFGIGWEGFNDDLLEVLSRNGDGRYGFINSPEEAATEFAGQLAGALKVAASDVKVQVEFNPKRVTTYRQIGYAKHQLTKEQFRDNTVDAAEIAAQEAGNALYTVEVNPAGQGPLATVRVRYKIPGTTDYHEHAWAVPYTGGALSLEQSSAPMRLAASAGAFSEWLVASPFAAEVTPDRVLGYLSGVPEIYGADERPKKLEWMVRQAKSIEGK